MAFVLVQHLDRSHESILAELLAKVTEMTVSQAQQGMSVKANNVYVIPPGKDMTMASGLLNLTPRSEKPGSHSPIDIFFRSLAEDQQDKSIGVVLSGSGADGAIGLEEINRKGGVTLVQEPQTAQFDSMPRSAIATERINFVLPPDLIAKQLMAISKHPFIRAFTAGEKGLSLVPTEQSAFTQILEFLRDETGIDFSHYKQNTIHRRVLRRMLMHRVESFSDYLVFLRDNRREMNDLYDDILIKVTRFFRDPKEFEILKSRIFPEIIKGRTQDTPIRIWVPGCSTGEEVYSLAMYLREFLEGAGRSDTIQIFGTDISDTALEKARAGVYTEAIEEDVSPGRLGRFFSHQSGSYQISKTVRDLCIFAKQNVLRDPPFSKLDLVSCRNVLIYLDSDLQKSVLSIFHFSLKTKGWLMLGGSETVGSMSGLFSTVDKAHRIFLKQGVGRVEMRTAPTLEPRDPDRRTGVPGIHGGQGLPSMQKEVDRVLIRRVA